LLHSCAKVREAIKLPLGEVSWVGQRVCILDGVYIDLARGGGGFGGFSPISLNGVLF